MPAEHGAACAGDALLAAQLNAEASGQPLWEDDLPSSSQPAQPQPGQQLSPPESSHHATAATSADAERIASHQQAGSSCDGQPEASGQQAKGKVVQIDDDEDWEPATGGADSSDDDSDEDKLDAGMQLAMLPEGAGSLDPAVSNFCLSTAYSLQRDCMTCTAMEQVQQPAHNANLEPCADALMSF